MPPDAFQILSLPARAALEEETLQQAYAIASRAAHPDHGGSEAHAAQVNGAYETLRSPEKRLKHLIEIAGPTEARVWRTVALDESMMSAFMALGSALDASAKFLEKKSRATTSLTRALLAAEEFQHRESLESIGFDLDARRTVMESSLPDLDTRLESQSPGAWEALAATQARLAYVAKWQTQIRERLLALM